MLSIRLRPEKHLPRILVLLTVVVSAAVFLPALDNQLVSDDWVFVYRGVAAESVGEALDTAEENWFSRPAMWLLSFGLAQLSGTDATGFRVGSLFLHAANAWLLGSLFLLLLGRWPPAEELDPSTRRLAAYAATAFFLLYPLHHEAVFWYSSITELTALFGRLLALHACARSLDPPRNGRARHHSTIWAFAAIGVALALGSKESAVVLPGELFLLVLLARHRPDESRSLFRRPWTAWGLVASSSLVTFAWLLWYRSTRGFSVDQLVVLEATPVEWMLRITQGVVRAVLGGTIVRDPVWISVAVALGAAGVVLAAWRNQRPALFGGGWLVLCLLPYLCIGSVADHQARVPVLHRNIGISDDRYFYGAGAALSFLLLGLVLWAWSEAARLRGDLGRSVLRCGIALLVVGSLVGAWRMSRYERQWDAAGDLLDTTRREIAAELTLPVEPRELICVHGRPDNLDGRYVLRNGIAELLWLHAGHRQFRVLVPPAAETSAHCRRHLFLGD